MTRDPAPLLTWRLALAAVALTAIAAGIAAQIWIPLGHPVPGEFSDSVDYLVFADYFRNASSGKLTPTLVSFFSVTRFPPLFPLALWAVGAGLRNPMPAYWLTALMTSACFLLAAAWLARECRSLAAGLVLAAAITLTPGLHLLTLNPVSEPMFLAMALVILLWSARIQRVGGSVFVFCAFVGLLPLCRMAGVTIVAATATWLMVQRIGKPRDRVYAIAIMLLPALSWLLYRRLMPVTHSYTDALDLERVLGAFGGWQGWILGQPQRIADAYLDLIQPWTSAPGGVTWLVAFVFAAGLAIRLRRRALDAIALIFYLALVYCWPYPAEMPRLIGVTLPMAALCFWETVHWLIERIRIAQIGAPELASLAVAVVILSASVPFMVEASSRALAATEPDLEPFKRSASYFRPKARATALEIVEINARVASLMDEIPAAIPKGECVFTFFPNVLLVHGPALDARVMPYPPRDAKPTPDQFSECRYVLVTYQTSLQVNQPLLYPWSMAADWLEPALVSNMNLRGQEVLAAALMRRVDPPEHRGS